jgi:ABC-type uncharacterized transport system ATPase subunit
MKKIFIVLTSLFLLSSCTTTEDMNKGLARHNGQHIHTLIMTIGYPNVQREIAGRKLYIWDSRQNVSFSIPQTSSSTIIGPSGVYTGTSTTMSHQNIQSHCTITVEVTSTDTIVNYEWYGNYIGCERFAQKFRF